MSITENLTYLRNNLMAEREKLLEVTRNAPACRLVSRGRKNGAFDIYIRSGTNDPAKPFKDVYVNRSLKVEAAKIARYMVAKYRLRDVNKVLKVLGAFKKALEGPFSFDIYLRKHPWLQAFLDTPLDLEDELLIWKKQKYERNMKYPEGIKYTTIVPDLKVRSKSEADIVARLENFGVPYHYDEVSYINGVRINVDFVCMNVTTGKIWYWDHRGMLDNPSYIEKTLFCEKQFLNAGIILGKNLIVTTETANDPLSIPDVDAMIQLYLL